MAWDKAGTLFRDAEGNLTFSGNSITLTSGEVKLLIDNAGVHSDYLVDQQDIADARNRVNHHGLQDISTVTGLQALLNNKQSSGNYVTTNQAVTIWTGTQAQYDAANPKPTGLVFITA